MSLESSAIDVGIPTPSDGFVGRERELARVVSALAGPARLVTLLGPGGVGKTRLAAAVTDQLRKNQCRPVHWVHLARLRNDATIQAVEDEIVTTVVDGDFSARTGRQALIDTIGRTATASPTVLVLDNCEHVLVAVGTIVDELLDAIPGLVVLATSRTAIGWTDEQLVTIPPLSRDQAIALFRRRAELAGRPVAEAESALVEPICRHMHFYPLHIGLAAVRLRYQTLPMILRDLDDFPADRRLRWSPGFRVGLDERHRDINAVIGWSYELCTPKEQLLFQRMSVFAAGFDINPVDADTDAAEIPESGADLEAIEAVCADADAGGLLRHEIPGLLEQLVDRSLVALQVGATAARYSLLESFRLFAHERLLQNGDQEYQRLAARHRRHYRDRVDTVRTHWVSPSEQELLTRTRADWDNIANAISSSVSHPDEAVIGLEIAILLIGSRLPFLRGSLRESRNLAESSLSAALRHGRCPSELEVSARAVIGWLVLCQGLAHEADRLLDECAAACLSPENSAGWRDDPHVDRGLPAAVEHLWGSLLLLTHADPRAGVVLARARVKFTDADDPGGAMMSGLFEALSASFHATAAHALDRTRAMMDSSVAAGPQWAISWAGYARAIALSAHGDTSEALALCHAGLEWQIPMRDKWGSLWGVHIRMWIFARMITQKSSTAQTTQWATSIARMVGGTAVLRHRMGIDLTNLGPFAHKTTEAIDIARNVLGSKAFESARLEGEQMPEVELLIEEPATAPEDRTPIESGGSKTWAELTAAEQEVAVLAAAGLTNTAIATRRGTSTRTVDAQIAAILFKLSINSRKNISAFLPQNEQDRAGR